MTLPPPTTFAEGQRKLFGCLVALAGMFAGAVCLLFIAIYAGGVWLHIWPVPLYAQIISILGYGFGGFICAMIAVILTLAVGGPVGRFKGGASIKDGVNFDLANDQSAGSITASTPTATVTVTPPQGGTDAGPARP